MKKYFLFALIVPAITFAGAPSERAQEGKELIKSFATELKTSLKGAVKKGGFSKGVDVCSVRAPEIARLNSDENWTVSRTSLKPRNSNNRPTTTEQKVLLDFEAQLKSGTPVSQLVYTNTMKENGVEEFHLMKAIPTQGLCLSCHGQNLSEDVTKILNERYPDDSATGYKEGDIRGAFSLVYRGKTGISAE